MARVSQRTMYFRVKIRLSVYRRLRDSSKLMGFDLMDFSYLTTQAKWPYIGWLKSEDSLRVVCMALSLLPTSRLVERGATAGDLELQPWENKRPKNAHWVVVPMEAPALEATRTRAAEVGLDVLDFRVRLIRCLLEQDVGYRYSEGWTLPEIKL